MKDLKILFSKYAIYFVLVFEIIFFSFASEYFLSATNFVNVLRQVSIVGIMAVGMTFVILTGGVDLSVGGVTACVGVICAKLMVSGWNPLLAVLISLGFTALVGCVNAFFSHEFRLNPMIVTLATLQILKGISYIVTGAIPVYGFTEEFKVIGQGHIGQIPIPIIIMLVLYIVAYIVLKYTKFGQSIYGIGGNEEAVRLTGINIRKSKYGAYILCSVVFVAYIVLKYTKFGQSIYGIGGNEEAVRLTGINIRKSKYGAYILCSVVSGIAGIVLLSRANTAQPSAGFGYEMDVIAGAVLGGISMSGGEGKITGVFAGVLVMAILSNGMLMMDVSEYWQWVTKGIVMLAAITYDRVLKKG